MFERVNIRLASFISVAVILQTNFHVALSDFRVRDKWTNEVIFQTSSDFIRTGCGTLHGFSRLNVAEPFDACEVPAGPPLKELSNDGSKEEWILLVLNYGKCDLKTIFRNAASAGYSGVIVGSNEPHGELLNSNSPAYTDDEEFIDVHLVNTLDITILSKKFAYPNEFRLDPPTPKRCREEYQKTWLRSQYLSRLIRAWRRGMETIWTCATWLFCVMGKLTLAIKSMMPMLSTRDTFSSITISLASIIISITVMMIVSIKKTSEKITKYKSLKERGSFTRSTSCSDEDSNRRYEFNGYFNSTPSQPLTKPSHNQQGSQKDYTLHHRLNLDIKLNETLTKSKVNNAYRDMALKYHPDKNRDLEGQELEVMTHEFWKKKKSRDILLLYCTE